MITRKSIAATLLASGMCLALVPGAAMAGHGNSGSHGKSGSHGNSASSQEFTNASADSNSCDSNGCIASELKWMNSAHASPTALEHASPNSRVGKNAAYAAAYKTATNDGNTLYNDYVAANGLPTDANGNTVTERYFLAHYTDYVTPCDPSSGACTDTVSTDAYSYQQAQTDVTNTLNAVTGGRTISDAAMKVYNSLLGLVKN